MRNKEIQYSILITHPDSWDEANLQDQYIYEIIESYDWGTTWHHIATMANSDAEQAAELVKILNNAQHLQEEVKYFNSQEVREYFKEELLEEESKQKKLENLDNWDIHDD